MPISLPSRSARRRTIMVIGLIVLGIVLLAEFACTNVFSLHGLLTGR